MLHFKFGYAALNAVAASSAEPGRPPSRKTCRSVLCCEPAQYLEDIDAGYALLQRTAIKARSNEQRDSVRDHQVGVVVNLLQAPFLFQLNNVLGVGSNNIRRLTPVLRMGDDRRTDLLRGAVVDQSVADANPSYIRSAQRGARGTAVAANHCVLTFMFLLPIIRVRFHCPCGEGVAQRRK